MERERISTPRLDPIEGEGWRLEPIGLPDVWSGAVRWHLYVNTSTNQRPYKLRWFWNLGWQAWWNEQPVTGYVQGSASAVAPALVQELRVSEVEDTITPPPPQKDWTDEVSGMRLRNRQKYEALVRAAESQTFDPIPTKRRKVRK